MQIECVMRTPSGEYLSCVMLLQVLVLYAARFTTVNQSSMRSIKSWRSCGVVAMIHRSPNLSRDLRLFILCDISTTPRLEIERDERRSRIATVKCPSHKEPQAMTGAFFFFSPSDHAVSRLVDVLYRAPTRRPESGADMCADTVGTARSLLSSMVSISYRSKHHRSHFFIALTCICKRCI